MAGRLLLLLLWQSLCLAFPCGSLAAKLNSTRLDSTLALSALLRPLTSDVKQNRRALIIWWQHSIKGKGEWQIGLGMRLVGAVETLGHGPRQL